MKWLQISFEIKNHKVDFVSEVLIGLGSVSINYFDAKNDAIYEPAVGETPLWPNVILTALFPSDVNKDFVKSSIFDICNVDILTSSNLKERDWLDECKKDFHSMQFGQNLWVCPSWDSKTIIPDNAIIIHMDPGLAFGTGSHQTTNLCLEYLETYPPINKVVVDYGCGTGILAIAAAKLGASSVLAIDNDPQAVIACKENSLINKCEVKIKTVHSSYQVEIKQCDLLIANILTNTLIELAPKFAALLKTDGSLLLSGILKEQVEKVINCYSEYFVDLEVTHLDDWCRIVARRL
jgi:ribosomal protein L11 methyltransferase